MRFEMNRKLAIVLAAAVLTSTAVLAVAPTASACMVQVWYVDVTTEHGGATLDNCHVIQVHEGGETAVEADTILT